MFNLAHEYFTIGQRNKISEMLKSLKNCIGHLSQRVISRIKVNFILLGITVRLLPLCNINTVFASGPD